MRSRASGDVVVAAQVEDDWEVDGVEEEIAVEVVDELAALVTDDGGKRKFSLKMKNG